jgi:hypothetical protein
LGKVIKYNRRVKLITGLIYKDEAIFVKTKNKLERRFGKIDFESRQIDFNYTDYYEAEMGKDLKRRFISFVKLIPIHDLYRIKLFTNRLESKLSVAKNRTINIDPGYIDSAKLVLASTKDYAHRIYLRKGIFAEITLSYRHNSFSRNEWTYPDYCTKEYIDIFNQIRKLYIR